MSTEGQQKGTVAYSLGAHDPGAATSVDKVVERHFLLRAQGRLVNDAPRAPEGCRILRGIDSKVDGAGATLSGDALRKQGSVGVGADRGRRGSAVKGDVGHTSLFIHLGTAGSGVFEEKVVEL